LAGKIYSGIFFIALGPAVKNNPMTFNVSLQWLKQLPFLDKKFFSHSKVSL